MAKFLATDEVAQPQQSGSGPLTGPFQVVTSVFRVQPERENKNKAGEIESVTAAHTALVWSVVPLDQDGDKIEDAEPREIAFGFGGKSLASFHPGNASSATDDPTDAGDEPLTEGPTIYAADSSAQIHPSTGFWVLRNSLS